MRALEYSRDTTNASGPRIVLDNASLRDSMGSSEEPDRKRRHLNNNNHSVSPSVKKLPLTPSSEEKKVDAQTLQFQNQQLEIKLDIQRNEVIALEGKLNQLLSKQTSFDDNLSIVNRVWSQVVDSLDSLTVRASAATNGVHVSGSASKEWSNASDTFLQRLLDTGATESSTANGNTGSVESGLCSRKSTTAKTIMRLVQSIDSERSRREEIVSTFRNGLISDGNFRSLVNREEELYAEAKKLQSLVDDLHLRHRQLSVEMGTCHDIQAKDRAEVKRLTGELEEAHAQMEASKRQLATLRSEDVMPTPSATPTGKSFELGNGGEARENFSGATCHLEAGLEEAKTLAARRLTELQEALQNHLDVIQKIQKMQDELDDQDHILSSQQYQSLNEQVQDLRIEVEKCRALVDQLQGERVSLLRREKDVTLKAEAGDAARKASIISDSRAADLELRLQQCMSDCDNLQLRVEDASQASGRKESVADLKIVISTLHKEMSMMHGQLFEFKEEGSLVHSLRADLHMLQAIFSRKRVESRRLSDQYGGNVGELKLLQNKVKVLREKHKELKLVLDMFNRESNDPREVRGLQQAECRAWVELERLQCSLGEHNLEIRVKAANEAEAACQQKLTAVEAEITEVRQSLETSDRVSLDLKKDMQANKEEEDAYISEIYGIGQAYEDMQTQNHRLLQGIIEFDEYNAQLMSESLEAKQLQTSLHAEKQVLNAHMQHANAASDLHKQRVARLEEQARMFIDQLGKATDESRQQTSAMESTKRRAVEVEKELNSAKLALESAHKVLEDRGQKLLNVNLQLEKERFEKRRALDELEVLNAKISRLPSPHHGPMVERLQEEINDYKNILKCSVCHERPKEVVITKCYHLFCGKCIQRNLELRNRKCPGCGIQFGQNDVRTVYI